MASGGKVSALALAMMVIAGPGISSAQGMAQGTMAPGTPGLAQDDMAAPDKTPQSVASTANNDASTSVVGGYLAGRYAQRHNDWATAANYLRQVLGQQPGDASLVRRTFALLLGDGRIAEALPLARQVITFKGDNHIAQLLLLADAIVNDRLAEANDILKGLPGDGVARLLRPLLEAWLRVAEGQPAAGLALLRSPPKIGDSKLLNLTALYALHQGLVAEYAADIDSATRAYAALTVDDDTPWRVVDVIGTFYERQGRIAEARSLYDAFRRRNPDTLLLDAPLSRLERNEPPPPLQSNARLMIGDVLGDLASAFYEDGSNEMSFLYGRIALHVRPQASLVLLLLGDILLQRRQVESALPFLRAAAEDPELGWIARLHLADGLELDKRIDDAAALLAHMAEERPERIDALARLGDLLRGNRRYAEAVAVYDRAIARVAKIEPRHWSLFYARGMVNERAGHWPQAEADLLRANALSPDEPYVLNYLGYSWVDRGLNLKQAREMIERAVRLRPEDGHIADSLGWVLYLIGDIPAAVTHMERAVELRPSDPTINNHLGDVYWAAGRRHEARFQWERTIFLAEERLKHSEHERDGDETTLITTVRRKLEQGL